MIDLESYKCVHVSTVLSCYCGNVEPESVLRVRELELSHDKVQALLAPVVLRLTLYGFNKKMTMVTLTRDYRQSAVASFNEYNVSLTHCHSL